MNNEIDIVFALLRAALDGSEEHSATLSLCHSATQSLSTHRWWRLFRLMQQNHVAAMTADTVAGLDVPREVMIPWLAERDKAERWHRYQKEVQQEIVATMQKHGIETLVLKGTHTAQYYPNPELREFGDLDLYFYDKHDEADRIAEKELGVTVSNDAHHHSKYNYRGVTVESHYDFLNTHYPPSNRRYEALLKELVFNPTNSSPKLGEGDRRKAVVEEYVSPFNFHFSTFELLFLLRHMACHFAASRITLRDLVDWTLTCQALHDKVDWDKVNTVVNDFGMEPFVAALTAIASQRLGYSVTLSLCHSVTQPLCHSVTQPLSHSATQPLVEKDLLFGSVADHASDGLARLGWKFHRWRANAWKRHMVFSDSEPSLLLASLTSHAEKPTSILHKM